MSMNKSFLIIDDSATMRQLINIILKKSGCKNVMDAPNGRVGLEKLAAKPVDIVLTDIDMPEMNGLEFIERAREQYADLPIIVLSTHGDEATRDKGLMLGANDYLTKPLSSFKLMEMMEKIFPESSD